jgi:hypothetical protein
MTDLRTTICGAVAAAAGALSQVPGLPSDVKLWTVCIAAVALALFGFFAKDAAPAPRVPTIVAGALVALAVILIAAGCTVARFSLGFSNPSLGSLRISVGGGAVGKPAEAGLFSNYPAPLAGFTSNTPPQTTGTTNESPQTPAVR